MTGLFVLVLRSFWGLLDYVCFVAGEGRDAREAHIRGCGYGWG